MFVSRDCELSTSGVDQDGQSIDPWQVTQKVLGQIPAALEAEGGRAWNRRSGYWSNAWGWGGAGSTDCLRTYTSGGQCTYADMSHVEVCTAPTRSARSFAAQNIGLTILAEAARKRAVEELDGDANLRLSAANVDMLDPAIAWGTHFNASVSTPLWEDLFVTHRRPARLGFVASAVAAAAAFFGTGYLLPLSDGSFVYSLCSRAHHLSHVHTMSTTDAFHRGLLNRRREAHARDCERLHLISLDFALVGAARLAAFMQAALIAAEEGFSGLQLYDPVRALRSWSWNFDPDAGRFTGEAQLAEGGRITLPQYMLQLTDRLQAMVASGLIRREAAPDVPEMLEQIHHLAEAADRGAIEECAAHLDWAAKLFFLLGSGHPLGSPESRLADHDFADTDPERGAFWQLWEAGLVDPMVTPDEARATIIGPPEDSRAWAIGYLIREHAEQLTDVNWDRVEVRGSGDRWSPRTTIRFPDLATLNRREMEPLVRASASLDDLVERIEAYMDEAVAETDPLDSTPTQLAVPPRN